MKKFLNRPEELLQEGLKGFGAAHGSLVGVHEQPTFVHRKSAPTPGKVAIISGGGSGHEPLHIGYVGLGMLDAACPGEIFTSPTPDQIIGAASHVDGGAGVLFIVKNYSGDRMNFELASEELSLPHTTLIVADEALQARSEDSAGEKGGALPVRRGLAGTVIVEKMVGAAAEQGKPLAECLEIGEQVVAGTRTMGVALGSCTPPVVRKKTFTLNKGEVEYGVGIHGEPGRRRMALKPAQELYQDILDVILSDLGARSGDEVLLQVNGLGGATMLEQYLAFDCAREFCLAKGLKVSRTLVGSHVTCLEMPGISLTVSCLTPQLKALWDAPVHTPALRWGV